MALFRKKPQQMSLPGMDGARGRGAKVTAPDRPGAFKRLRGSLTTVPMTRRRFLAGTLGWVTAAIATALGIPALAAWVSPALRKQSQGWSPIGKLTDPGPDQPDLSVTGTPIEAHFTRFVQDAYLQAQPQEVAVYVVNEGEGKFTIFDDHCTHLGCPYSWNLDKNEFDCPCHNGVFDPQGRVLGGPPPRPLDRYEFKVENGVLYAGKLFRVNDQLQRITQ
jgi:Rieske Fe-S protein